MHKPLSELDIKERKLLLLSQSEEMERLRAILHEQGRQIDELRLENSGQRKRIESLETCLEEEAARRQGESEWARPGDDGVCRGDGVHISPDRDRGAGENLLWQVRRWNKL